MVRYAACVEYDGSGYHGWQIQKHQENTVQGKLELALSKVADSDLHVITAGRTDTGVHATHQIIHFESDVDRSLDAWLRGSNRFLPHSIRLKWVVKVEDDFHARFSALARSYRYIIDNSSIASALYHKYSTQVKLQLNAKDMHLAAQYLLGEHDFSAFRASACQSKTAKRNVHSISVNRYNEWICVDIKANAFLQHMVRNIVGSLLAVGAQEQKVPWVKTVLQSRDRTQAGVTAPANGLYLVGVEYQEPYLLPSYAKLVQFW